MAEHMQAGRAAICRCGAPISRSSRLNLPRDVREPRVRGTRPIGRDPEGQERGRGRMRARRRDDRARRSLLFAAWPSLRRTACRLARRRARLDGNGRRAGAGLSQPADQARGRLHRRRHHRFRRAPARRAAPNSARTARHRREPAGRERRDRRRIRRQVGPRRLHLVLHHGGRGRDQSGIARQPRPTTRSRISRRSAWRCSTRPCWW